MYDTACDISRKGKQYHESMRKRMSCASPKYLTTISAYVNHISRVGLNML